MFEKNITLHLNSYNICKLCKTKEFDCVLQIFHSLMGGACLSQITVAEIIFKSFYIGCEIVPSFNSGFVFEESFTSAYIFMIKLSY